MKNGEIMFLKFKIFLLLILICFNSFAIDNPEKTVIFSSFIKKANSFERKINQEVDDYKVVKIYADYNKYLEKELNLTYSKLLKSIDADSVEKFTLSQKKWLAYRDSEIEFINENYVPKNFGSSSRLSRPAHIAKITKNRIQTLLLYYIEY